MLVNSWSIVYYGFCLQEYEFIKRVFQGFEELYCVSRVSLCDRVQCLNTRNQRAWTKGHRQRDLNSFLFVRSNCVGMQTSSRDGGE